MCIIMLMFSDVLFFDYLSHELVQCMLTTCPGFGGNKWFRLFYFNSIARLFSLAVVWDVGLVFSSKKIRNSTIIKKQLLTITSIIACVIVYSAKWIM